MNHRACLMLLALACLAGWTNDALGQMFGNRSLGTPVANPTASATAARTATGTATGSSVSQGATVSEGARFLRKNRNAQAFVGADAQDASHFVGTQEMQDGITPILNDLRSRTAAAAAANRQLQASASTPVQKTSMYPPRLEVSFAYSPRPTSNLSTVLLQRLKSCSGFQPTGPIEVSLAGRTATLRGTVASEWDRSLAQQMLLFEPGISLVQNELTIQPAASNSPPQPKNSSATP